jgi:uncharacterized protein (DUF3820 family)
MKKYRIVKHKELYKWGWGEYSARDCWDVEERILFFFWYVKKGFWEEKLAKSYYNALLEISNEQKSNS